MISAQDMESKKFRFSITDKADSDLDEIVRYISEELLEPKAASSFIERFLSVVDDICVLPESGALVDNDFVSNRFIRHKMVGNYIVYYLPDNDLKVCTVLRVVYGGRDQRGILERLSDDE